MSPRWQVLVVPLLQARGVAVLISWLPIIKTCHYVSSDSSPNLRWPGPILPSFPLAEPALTETPQDSLLSFAVTANYPTHLFLLLGGLFYQAIIFTSIQATQILI